MKIANKTQIDSKTNEGSMELVLTTTDDLYALGKVVRVGDEVESLTTRKISFDAGKTQTKINTKLRIKIETLDFDLTDGNMFLKGKVCGINEYVQVGLYHSLNVGLGDKFLLYKKSWSASDRGIINASLKEAPGICFVVFYDKECVVSIVSPSNIRVVHKEELKNKNFKNIIKGVGDHESATKIIVVASVSEVRNEFAKTLFKEKKALESKTAVIKLPNEYKNIPNSKVVGKVMVDRQYEKIFSEIRYVEDLRAIESVLERIDKNEGGVAIGMKEINEAFEYGAIKTIYMTDKLYRPQTIAEREKVEKLEKEASKYRAKICVIPLCHENGEKLMSLGGVIALLLFEYK